MGAGENVDLIRRAYEAFNAGDMETLSELFAEDAVWLAPGNGSLSGRKEGRDAILAYFGELGTRSDGQLKVTVQGREFFPDTAQGDAFWATGMRRVLLRPRPRP